MTTDISKAGFYRNWYEIAKDFETAEERLAFYDMIFEYFFEGKEPEKQTIGSGLYRLFMSVKANIEADIERRNGGAPEGNNNARKGKSCRKCVYRRSCSNASRATNAELCPDFKYPSEGNMPKTTQNNPKQTMLTLTIMLTLTKMLMIMLTRMGMLTGNPRFPSHLPPPPSPLLQFLNTPPRSLTSSMRQDFPAQTGTRSLL